MDSIQIRGARTHNLKNIHLDLPRDQLIVITGLSGQVSLRLPLTHSMLRANDAMLNRCLHMQDSSYR